jgi:hypothetical protein
MLIPVLVVSSLAHVYFKGNLTIKRVATTLYEEGDLVARNFGSGFCVGAFPTYSNKGFAVNNSNVLAAKMYSCLALADPKIKLDPYFVTGFIDAEGCFAINLLKNLRYKTG